MVEGDSNLDIVKQRQIATTTTCDYVTSILQCLGVKSRAHVEAELRLGILRQKSA